ncbi:jg26358, partial [Pararge aegeria aegeria]
VGRIIGKGGQNVRELQRVTGSLIKLPEQPQPLAAAAHDHETTVHIVGPFYSVQLLARCELVDETVGDVSRHNKCLNVVAVARRGMSVVAKLAVRRDGPMK